MTSLDPLSVGALHVRVSRPARRSRKGLRATIGGAALAAAVLLVLIVLAAPGLLAHVSPVATSDANLQGPSGAHLFGTDLLGRDVFSRTVYGARPVLLASLLGVLLATASGVAIGVLGGVAPRLVNALVMRLVDVFLALPVLLIALILIATAGSGVRSIVLAIGVAFTPGFARVVESSVRRLRKAEYVEAARVFGSSTLRTSWRHLLPNLLTEVVVLGSSAIGWGVLTATTLSFLGLGVRLPAPDWGSDLAAGATNLADAWWLSTFPGLAIMATILLANFSGDHLMRVLDPRARLGRGFRHLATRLSRPGGETR
ncbi:peptide/nickel transport system permease protein [Kribbella orskensis]|uniref:Peptide/nickel transport system permease protein n=1 Tax=Kribbella orskensis TaxID=2512216 RepID=A0ABY2BND2_9ACTN|nr:MULTISPECIES: ABC transporter permease [Kribbella]TCN42068.1 peptide/nickel transport system permease protein [Kribbella sp. VKM Ac-2500]TCO25946.1 peptide/nickel transport system permease protein [Kribbella orskensis]